MEEVRTASRIVIELASFPEVEDGRKVICMKVGEECYIMLMVKNALLAYSIAEQVKKEMHAELISGLAFDYHASMKQSLLVIFCDVKYVGLYVKVQDFPKVRDFFDQ